MGGFLSGPVVKNLPTNAGDTGSIPPLGRKILHTEGQPSLWATTAKAPRRRCWPLIGKHVLLCTGREDGHRDRKVLNCRSDLGGKEPFLDPSATLSVCAQSL